MDIDPPESSSSSAKRPAKFKLDMSSLLFPHERAQVQHGPRAGAGSSAASPASSATPSSTSSSRADAFGRPVVAGRQTSSMGERSGQHAPPAPKTQYVPVPVPVAPAPAPASALAAPLPAAPLSPPASLMSTPPQQYEAACTPAAASASASTSMSSRVTADAVARWAASSAQSTSPRSAAASARPPPARTSAAPSTSGSMSSAYAQPEAHPRLDDWEVVETLGTGTFGRVLLVRQRPSYRPISFHPIFPHLYQSFDPRMPSPGATREHDGQLPHFAMKVLRKSEIVRLKQVEHIRSERRILERVRHPFVVELYATYQDNVNVYMLLSYIPGGELFSHLRRAGRFTPDVTRFYLACIVLAIEHLHSRNIIYRDLKPENLLLDRSGYLRIADFGFAKVVQDRTFTLCGTPEYLAPEIVLSQGHGKAVDWWALGILAFEMLAGYPPFFDESPMGIYEKILRNEIAFPGHIDPYAKDLIRGLLTTDRSKRLGNLRGGAQDIRDHPWFSGVEWGQLERKGIGAPIVPRVGNSGDSQNFQRYAPPRPSELPGIFGAGYDPALDANAVAFADFAFPDGTIGGDGL
ncbi:cytochrome c oxidase subunit 1 [Cryptotrichosporon argae]